MTRLTEHFTKEEFACRCGCGTGEISMILVDALEYTRVLYGKPMRINSGLRCLSHNPFLLWTNNGDRYFSGLLLTSGYGGKERNL
jgi:hypothetical protein